jgi:5S rRNA maturation endonuclease (ribonuclease M5)
VKLSSSERTYPRNDHEIRERIMEWIEEMGSLKDDPVILVEGRKDVDALETLGIEHRIVDINRGMNLFDLIEKLKNGNLKDVNGPYSGTVIILTDWDRRGGMLASRLKRAALHFDLVADTDRRKQLVWIVGKWVKDVESLPSFLEKLESDTHLT